MIKEKNKKSDIPMTPEMMEMAKEKLFKHLQSQNFGSIDEINEYLRKNVNGKPIDKVIPLKKGRKSNIEKSDDLIYQAYEMELSKGRKLAKEAYLLNPENIRTLNYLGDCEDNIDEAFNFYKQAVEIGAKQLGKKFFIENKGQFWGLNETRAYMTARLNYADCLYAIGKTEESVKEYYEMIELNPYDNQGIRYILSRVLLKNKMYKSYKELYNKFKDEESAYWLFNYALFLYATEGASDKANKALDEANKQNKYVIPYMTARKKINSKTNGYYSPGDEREATYYLMENFKIWTEHFGTIDWLFNYLEKNEKKN